MTAISHTLKPRSSPKAQPCRGEGQEPGRRRRHSHRDASRLAQSLTVSPAEKSQATQHTECMLETVRNLFTFIQLLPHCQTWATSLQTRKELDLEKRRKSRTDELRADPVLRADHTLVERVCKMQRKATPGPLRPHADP